MSKASKLIACLLNVSEARNSQLIENIAKAAISTNSPTTDFKCDSVVLNIFSDKIYNRSVISIGGTLEGVRKSVIAASEHALNNINILNHDGGHPRKGAVDLIPIHPITQQSTLDDCAKIALDIGKELTLSHSGLSVFYFGHADGDLKRDLVQRRKELGWFEHETRPSFGALRQKSKHGLTGIGASPYMSNFNVMLETNNLEVGQNIAWKIRERTGGLLGVQAMAFPHGENQIEVACNVDLVLYDEKNPKHKVAKEEGRLVHVMGNYFTTPFQVIEAEIRKIANFEYFYLKNFIKGDSVIIGFTPVEAGKMTEECLISGCNWAVGEHKKSPIHM